MGFSKARKRKDLIYLYLLFYMFWGFVFSQTVFANGFMLYFSFLLLSGAFLLRIIKYGSKGDDLLKFCIPYIVYTSFCWFLQFDFQNVAFWLVAMIVILTGASTNISNRIDFKLLFYFGLFALLGIAVQYFFSGFYNGNILPLFLNDHNETWVENYGYAGFTYQLATTAEILVCAECVVLFLWDEIRFSNRQWLKWTIVVLLIVAVFMTGKRTNSLIALLLPFVVYFFSKNRSSQRFVWFFSLFIVIGALYLYIVQNIGGLAESVVLRRAVFTMENSTFDDISSGRSSLWERAFSLFHDSPVFGIGTGRFRIISGYGTDVHNVYLQCLCEQGIVGLLLFVVMLVSCLVSTISTIRKTKNQYHNSLLSFSLALQITYILEGITENMNSNLEGYLLYAIAIAILLDCRYRGRIERANSLSVGVY